MKEPHPAAFTCNLYPAWCNFIISLNEAVAAVIDKQIEKRLKAARPYSRSSVIPMHRAIRKKMRRVIFASAGIYILAHTHTRAHILSSAVRSGSPPPPIGGHGEST